ncbi:acyltransferase [Kiloniella sp.]|uniref:acyltransferase n=1 Tax=Kiloniella sp. TaxID=1938587 RepID=UPI003A938419
MTRKTYIDPTSVVHEGASIGDGTMVWNWTKVRDGAAIGKDCNIGQCAYIDTGVTLGDECKVQNGVSIYQGVTIGNQVFVGPNVTFTNDRYPRAHSTDWKIVPTVIKDGVSIGANATIVCGVTLGENSMVAAGAVVTRDAPPHALVIGQPARVVDYVTVSGERLYHDMHGAAPTDEQLKEC